MKVAEQRQALGRCIAEGTERTARFGPVFAVLASALVVAGCASGSSEKMSAAAGTKTPTAVEPKTSVAADAGKATPVWTGTEEKGTGSALVVAPPLPLDGNAVFASQAAGGTDNAADAADAATATAAAAGDCDHTAHPHGCTDVKDASAVAAELSNPVGSLAQLTFKNQYRFYEGDLPGADSQSNYTLLFQPVFPFPVGETSSGGKANFFARPAFPLVVDQPVPGATGFKGVTALGDIGFDLAYGVTEKSGLIWAFGMTGTLPTATDSRVAGKQLRLGPEFFVGQATDWGLFGIFPSHQWNVVGWSDNYYAQSQIQPFLNINLPDAWQISTQPIIQYDWRGEQWNVPVNLIVSKTVTIADIPVRFQLEANYYVERNDTFAPEWQIGINITPVVSNFINEWVRGL